MAETYDVARLRRSEFPWADRTIYLNHAGIGPLPERARVALALYNDDRAAAYRLTEEQLFPVLDRARDRAARLIGARPGEIALTHNTSYGINLAARMLPLGRGDIVIVSHGEFPANVVPWRGRSDQGVVLELVPVTPRGWPDEDRLAERMRDPRVRVLALSSVQFHTGYAADLTRLSQVARETDTYFVIDAIQSLGQLPLDVEATPIDILCCGAQKYLLSPWGSGFMYVRRDLVGRLEPPFAGWMAFAGTDDFTRLTDYPRAWRSDARRFELITLGFQDFLGMSLALDLLLELGPDRIRDHLAEIARPVVEWAARRGVPLASPTGARGSGMVCLAPPDGEALFPRLVEAGVVASFREGAIRLSPHCYNTGDEMLRVTEILDRALDARGRTGW